MSEFITYKSSSPCGDLISFLAGIKELFIKTGKKGIIYQRLGMVGVGHPNSIHPFQNEFGESVAMNEYMFNMIKPLIKNQEYIEDYLVYNGEKIDFDFDDIRLKIFTNQPLGSLNRWFFYAFPDMACDLSIPWIKFEKYFDWSIYDRQIQNKIIVNFTQRYRNHTITYFFLKEYENNLIFSGLPEEHNLFCKTWNLKIPLLGIDDFLQLSFNLSHSKCLLSNQSMLFQIAEAIKHPRILESFHLMPNVIPIGRNAYDFYHQTAVEYYIKKLIIPINC